ncbi:MAG: type II secretion system F family protein, partial [Alicyclobacillus sp.]|nr:type II secretion system F family protein [Alicyclobacillus sp.]
MHETGRWRLHWSRLTLFQPASRPQDVAVFSRQLATLLRAGINVATGVQVLSAQADNPAFAKELKAVWEELQTGVQLSVALAGRPRMFPSLLVQLLRAGEASGTLDEALDRAGRYFERQHDLRQRVRTALTYPVLVMLVAAAACAVLFMKVVPVFSAILAAYHAQLPLPTRMVLAISRGLTQAWLPCLLLLLLAVAGWRYLLWRGYGVYVRDWLRLRLPVLRTLVHKSVLASFSRTLAALVQSGLPLLQALELTMSAVDNQVLARALAPVLAGVADGRLLSELLASVKVFPPLLVHMIRVGEESGHLDAMLDKAADFFEADAETLADRFKVLIEPFFILILAVIVGGIVLAVILPV